MAEARFKTPDMNLSHSVQSPSHYATLARPMVWRGKQACRMKLWAKHFEDQLARLGCRGMHTGLWVGDQNATKQGVKLFNVSLLLKSFSCAH